MKNFHDFSGATSSGQPVSFADFKGKKVLLVNTASACGFTPQYAVLQEVFETFGGEHFTILAFPSNDFGAQEPGSNDEIASFCEVNYGVTFPLMEKVQVKGPEMHPLFSWLSKKGENGVADAPITWNFQKFLIDENGVWVKSFAPGDSPASPEILDWIQQ